MRRPRVAREGRTRGGGVADDDGASEDSCSSSSSSSDEDTSISSSSSAGGEDEGSGVEAIGGVGWWCKGAKRRWGVSPLLPPFAAH